MTEELEKIKKNDLMNEGIKHKSTWIDWCRTVNIDYKQEEYDECQAYRLKKLSNLIKSSGKFNEREFPLHWKALLVVAGFAVGFLSGILFAALFRLGFYSHK